MWTRCPAHAGALQRHAAQGVKNGELRTCMHAHTCSPSRTYPTHPWYQATRADRRRTQPRYASPCFRARCGGADVWRARACAPPSPPRPPQTPTPTCFMKSKPQLANWVASMASN